MGVNVSDTWLTEVAASLNCKIGALPFSYFGQPIGGDPRKLSFWYPLIDHIKSRLSGWKRRNLSLGGCLVLLKSLLFSLPV